VDGRVKPGHDEFILINQRQLPRRPSADTNAAHG